MTNVEQVAERLRTRTAHLWRRREARYGIAAGLLVVLLSALAAFAVGAVLDGLAKARDYQEQIARFEAAIAQQDEILAALDSMASEDGAAAELLGGDSDALAAALLQDRLRSIVARSGGELEITQVLPPTQDGPLRVIAARAQLTATIPALQKILYAVETDKPFLFVDGMEIRLLAQSNRASGPESLRATLIISGRRRP